MFARYPWYFCQNCLAMAEDHAGRRLGFYNPHIGGGLGWRYVDDPDKRDETATEVVCFIGKRPVTVGEARFGGIVAEPVNSGDAGRPHDRNRVVLTGGPVSDEAVKRLKPLRQGAPYPPPCGEGEPGS